MTNNTKPESDASVLFDHRSAGLAVIGAVLALACAIGTWQWFHPVPTSANMAMANGDFKRAASFYQRAARKGDKRASTSLGNLYYLGLGVERDYEQASELYFEAAAAGVAEAQMNLGHLFKQGLGVETDPIRAFAWYNMANIHGNPAAEYYLNQISEEWTLSPLQINTAMTQWAKLSSLVEAGL